MQIYDSKYTRPYRKKKKTEFIFYKLPKKKKIFKSDRDNDQDRLKFLLNNFKFYLSQMKRKQEISRNYVIKYIKK